MRLARRLLALVVLPLLAAAALVLAAPAGAKTVWLCKPGLKHDLCSPGLATTRYAPGGGRACYKRVTMSATGPPILSQRSLPEPLEDP